MNIRLFCVIGLFQLVSARHTVIPKFFGQDSFVIVDANKVPLNQKHMQRNSVSHHRRPMHYPVYQIISQTPEKPKIEDPSPPSTTATPLTIFTKEDFPSDLLDIARNKLGIKSPDEIPSITELGELLGTQNVDDTIKYIRDLTATEEGLAFVKAYIESTDYTDSTGTVTSTAIPIEAKPTDVTSIGNAEEEPVQSLFARLSAYLNMFNIFTSTTAKTEIKDDAALQRIDRVSTLGTTQQVAAAKNMIRYNNIVPKPILVRHPLPYHYPIPLRPALVYRPKTSHTNLQSIVHLNTPKMRQPQLRAPFHAIKWTTKSIKLHQKQQQQQELEDLAARVSKFPLAHDREALVDAQYAGAIEKAFAEDEELKTVLGSTKTLK